MTREERRQRVLAREYERFAQIQTGGATAQFMDAVKIDNFEMLSCKHLLAGSLDAPEFMPAGSTAPYWPVTCKRP